MVRTAINLYSVRELDEPMLETLDRVAAAGYDGVQFSGGFGDATPAEVADHLDEIGLDATGCHVDFDDIEADPAGVAETYETIGSHGLVVPWLSDDHFESREAALATAQRLDELAAALEPHGATLHYHNHAHEFVEVDGGVAFEVFADASSVFIEPDVGWIRTGGADPTALIRRYGDRIDLVHMKDMTADGEFCEIGDGVTDMQACADAAREVDASWLIYEHDEPDDPVASIDRGAEFLAGL
jgi:sugar phosphate isomerase/epimerase